MTRSAPLSARITYALTSLSNSPDWLALIELARRAGTMLLTRIAVILLGLVSTIIISRLLGPEGRGVLALATTVTAIGAQFGNLGFHAVLSQKISQDKNLLPTLFGNAVFIAFGLCGTGAILYGIMAQFIPQLMPVRGTTLTLALLAVPITVMYSYVSSILIALNKSHILNRTELANRFLGLLIILPLLLINLITPNTLLAATIIISLLLLIVMFYGIGLERQLIPLQFSLIFFKDNLGYGVRIYIACLFMYLVLKVDLLMVNAYLGTEAAGFYSLAVNLIDMVCLLPVVVGSLLHPKLSAMCNPTKQWHFTLKIFCIMVGFMLPICLISGLFARPAIHLLFGNTFLPSVTPFLWLLPAAYVLSINTVLMNFLASINAPTVTVTAPAIASIVNIACNLWLIPHYELIGAAIASIISYTIMLLIVANYCILLFKKSPSAYKKNSTKEIYTQK